MCDPRPGRTTRRCPDTIAASGCTLLLPEPHNSNVLTAEKESGLADVERGQRERCIRRRDAFARATCSSQDAPGEQQDEGEQEGRHPSSLRAKVPAGKSPTGTCGKP